LFDVGGFSSGVIGLVRSLLSIYMWIIIIRVLISWINPDPNNPVVQFLRGVTDPAIDALRRVLPPFFWSTGLDFTPLILIILLQLVMILLENVRI
jgi:YggT family protein